MSKALHILLVEDDPGDVFLMMEALNQSKFHNPINVVRDGVEAMAYLQRKPPYEDAERPDLVLLDLNLPRMDGREVLAAVKGDASLRSIPIVILTTSNADQDILQAYDLHANLYVNKPVDLDQILSIVQQIDDFFVSIVRLPRLL